MVGSTSFLRLKHSQIRTKEFKDKYGSLALDLQHREIDAMYFPAVFMLRRFIYALIIVLLLDKNYFQIQILVFKQSMVMAFQG